MWKTLMITLSSVFQIYLEMNRVLKPEFKFKGIPVYILPQLVIIINSVLVQSKYSTCWKLSLVTPIPKKNIINILSDFLPIGILYGLSKHTEKIIDSHLITYLHDNDILPTTQSDFL